MDIEKQMVLEENKTLVERVSRIEKDIILYKKKFNLCIEFIKSFTHLVPNAVVKFEEEILRMDNEGVYGNGEKPEQRTDNL